MEVNCSAGYEAKGDGCVEHITGGSPVQLVAGAIIGVLAVAAFGGILYYFFKNPEQFKSLLVSFLRMHLCVPLVCPCDMFFGCSQ